MYDLKTINRRTLDGEFHATITFLIIQFCNVVIFEFPKGIFKAAKSMYICNDNLQHIDDNK